MEWGITERRHVWGRLHCLSVLTDPLSLHSCAQAPKALLLLCLPLELSIVCLQNPPLPVALSC